MKQFSKYSEYCNKYSINFVIVDFCKNYVSKRLTYLKAHIYQLSSIT